MKVDGSKALWIGCVALAAIPLWVLAVAHPAFDYTHAWVSAHHATVVRSFDEIGIRALGGVPVQNNQPLTTQPDFYVDWPPLLDILLAIVSPVTGQTPGQLHLLMATLAAAVAAMLGVEVKRIFGPIPGLMTAIGFLLMPITLKYGYGIFQVHLAMAFGIASLCCWRRWADRGGRMPLIASAVLMALAVMTSWEPILLALGVFATVVIDSDRRRLLPRALVVAGAMGAALAAILALYATEVPWAIQQLYAKAMQQSGQNSFELQPAFRPHDLRYLENNDVIGDMDNVIPVFIARSLNLGYPALIAFPIAFLIVLVRRQSRDYVRAFKFLAPLTGVWLLWAVLMRRHYMVHEFESSLAAPGGAVAIGIVSAFLLDLVRKLSSNSVLRLLRPTAVALLAIALIDGGIPAFHRAFTDRAEHRGVVVGDFIQRGAPVESIVLTSEYSMVPMYYSHRHLIQGVEDDGVVLSHRDAFRSLCPDCPIYLAIPEDRRADFPILLAGKAPSAQDADFLLFRLAGPSEGLVAQVDSDGGRTPSP